MILTTTFPWPAYIAYIVLMGWTPGPNNITSMNNGLRVGFRRALVYNAGLAVGLFIIFGLSMAFSALLYRLIPHIELPMKFLGAAYMLYLALRTLFPAKQHNAAGRGYRFRDGIIIQFVNIKVMIAGLSAAGAYVLPSCSFPPLLFLFVLIQTVNSVAANIAWAAVGSALSGFYQRYQKQTKIIMALLLVYCAAALFIP
jgi:threonine/homoserine/homoserine lactone efflux protein